MDFSFSEFYNFVLSALWMILSFLAGRYSSKQDNKK